MRLKRAAIVGSAGFVAGYYLGARAGRERYEQMRMAVERLRKGAALAQLASERFRRVDGERPVDGAGR